MTTTERLRALLDAGYAPVLSFWDKDSANLIESFDDALPRLLAVVEAGEYAARDIGTLAIDHSLDALRAALAELEDEP